MSAGEDLPAADVGAVSAAAVAPDPLARLNPAQRAAVVHGVDGGAGAHPAPPLLVIAGAGSGKTNTLAHRVAHLIAHGADPSRILLLTFSRRAADEMGRRVRRILAQVAAGRPGLAQAELRWSGTFHAIGARLLRDWAGRIGLDPGFTIHDREDSADLMNLVRHELGLSATKQRFPQKGTCLAIYSAAVNTQAPLAEVLQARYPWCAQWEDGLKRLFRAYVEANRRSRCSTTTTCCCTGRRWWPSPRSAPRSAACSTMCWSPDEYQDTNPLQASILLAMKPDGRGLTVVGDDAQLDLRLPRRHGAQHSRLSRRLRSASAGGDAGAELPLHQAHPGSRQRGDRDGRRALHQEPVVRARIRSAPAPGVGQGRRRPGRLRRDTVLARREEGLKLKQQAVLFRASAHSARLELELTRRNIPFVKFGGLKFLEAAHVKDVLAVLRWAENPRDRIAGFRAIQLLAGIGPKTAGRVLDNVCAAPEGCALLAEQPVPEAARGLAGVRRARRSHPGRTPDGTRDRPPPLAAGAAPTGYGRAGAPCRSGASREPSLDATRRPVKRLAAGAAPYAVGEGLGVGPAACQWPVDFELACRWYEAQMPRLYKYFALRVLDIQELSRIAATSPSRQRFLTAHPRPAQRHQRRGRHAAAR